MNSNETITVPRRMFAQILLCAFRYSLGRRTYIVSSCRDWLTRYWDCLAPWHGQIHGDIERAIYLDRAGMKCDVDDWQAVLKLPVAGKAQREAET